MRGIGIEEQGIARQHRIGLVAMAVDHFALEHIEKFETGMLEGGEDIRLGGERDQIGLDHHRPMWAMVPKLILMALSLASPFAGESLHSLDKFCLSQLLIARKGCRHR